MSENFRESLKALPYFLKWGNENKIYRNVCWLGGFRTGLANVGNLNCVDCVRSVNKLTHDKYAQQAYRALYETEGVSTCLTSQGGGWEARSGLYFIDFNPNPLVTSEARLYQMSRKRAIARQDSGISKKHGEHSDVLIIDEDAPRAVMSPGRDTIRHQRRIKEPDLQLYKLAGNSVTTFVVTAISKKLLSEIEKLRLEDEKNAQSC